jgi:hypothetical protein
MHYKETVSVACCILKKRADEFLVGGERQKAVFSGYRGPETYLREEATSISTELMSTAGFSGKAIPPC